MSDIFVILIPLLPLAGATITGVFGARWLKEKSHLVACTATGLSFLCALLVLQQLLAMPPDARLHEVALYHWLSVGNLSVDIAFQLDPLSAVMILVVTGVGFLIHVYSIGYMHGDRGYFRFFCYLNLFTFFMLTLVLAANFVTMFVGWEGVGLCSFLLIGFWYEKPSAAAAGMKAFVVTRMGDFGLLLGMIAIFLLFGTLDFTEIHHIVAENEAVTLSTGKTMEIQTALDSSSGFLGFSLGTVICLLLFLGAVGKSAQLPLHVWLPDAMEGPTPVSALIHAATMVTAGVFLLGRMSFLFAESFTALGIVALVGASTAVFAALIAVTQRDIKKVLAYSTISQLGFMFMAMGTGAFVAGIFHLATHACFKALLFLGAGSVMHGMNEETDVRKMGALRAAMPVTALTFLIATLAIAGVPPFAGFFSKDEILWGVRSAFNSSIPWVPNAVYGLGLIGTILTAFYMLRLVLLTFYGKARWDSSEVKPHESPRSMTVPLQILAFLSIVVGFAGVPAILGFGALPNLIHEFLHDVLHPAGHYPSEGHSHAAEWTSMGVSVFLALFGLGAAVYLYVARPTFPQQIADRYRRGYNLLWNKFFVEEAYQLLFVRPFHQVKRICAWIDRAVIDSFVNMIGRLVQFFAFLSSRTETGDLQYYGVVTVAGVIGIVLYHLLV